MMLTADLVICTHIQHSEHWGFDVVCQIFVLLACRAALDVFRDPCSGARPEVFLIDVSDCFISPGVAIDGAFVPYVH
jgi:hypothetical protein